VHQQDTYLQTANITIVPFARFCRDLGMP